VKDKRVNVISGMALVSAMAAVALAFSSGCKSQPVKDNTIVPPPATLEPAATQPVSAQPLAALPIKPAPTALAAAPASTPAIPDVKADTSTYTVQKGDTFSKIAKKYGIGMKELADYNHMSLQKPLKIGVTLKIPQK